jgi:enoyl-CoA hydratase/carnithine racemase
MARARELAERIAARGPAATAVTKQLINAAEGEGDEAATLEGLAGAFASFTQDGAEGVASFRDKRPARYENR